jgi:predicted metal-binding membrane protein
MVSVRTQAGRVEARDVGLTTTLLAGAALGWWWSVRMAADMGGSGAMGEMSMAGTMSFAAYLVGWVAMMTAMMFPAIAPVVRLYARAAARGTVAPVPVFVAGYLLVWSVVGAPAYLLWRALDEPLAVGQAAAGRFAGVVLVVAAVYQLTPLKQSCLRHCRSPMSVFTHAAGDPARPAVAVRIGALHGTYCLGCCWALMAILVAMGTMNLAWMAILAVVILIEKIAPWGESIASGVAAIAAIAGAWLLIDPSTISTLT